MKTRMIVGCGLVAVLLLAGCAHRSNGGGAARTWCGAGAEQGAAVVVQVLLTRGEGGLDIDVSPRECRVRPGAQITWVATGPEADQFERIVFKSDSAASSGEREVPARTVGDQRHAPIVARWARRQSSFAYAVHAGGEVLDPDIIIDPARK